MPRLNSRVVDTLIFNRDKLHEGVNLEDIKVIKSVDSGDLSSNRLNQLLHAQHMLALKVGSPVMCLRNIDHTLKNGTQGTVLYFLNNYPVVKFNGGSVRYLPRSSMVLWTANYQGKIGKRLQLPLMLCYSFTVHKSQGSNLSAGELNADRLFAPGQGYTGLSRFTDLKRVRLLNYKGGSINIVSNEVVQYYKTLKSSVDDTVNLQICSSLPSDLGCCNNPQPKEPAEGGKDDPQEPISSLTVETTIQTHGGNSFPDSEPFTFEDELSDSESDPNVEGDIDERLRCFFSQPVSGPFKIDVSLTVIQCLNKLSTSYLPGSKSQYVADMLSFLQQIVNNSHLLSMYNMFYLFMWKTIVDIVISAGPGLQSLEQYSLTKDQCDKLHSEVEDVIVSKSIFLKWKFLADQVSLVSSKHLRNYDLQLILYSLVKIVFNAIITSLSVTKSSALIAKMKSGETLKIDTTGDEGRAVIRHLGGWSVHAVLADLNRYIISNASSLNIGTKNKVSCSIKLRQLLYDNLVVSSSEIHDTTSFPGTLQHTDYYNRGGLTFITDKCYLVFIELEQSVERYLQKSFLLQAGSRFAEVAISELSKDPVVMDLFTQLFPEQDQSSVLATESHDDNTDQTSSDVITDFETINFEDEIDIFEIPNFLEQPDLNFNDIVVDSTDDAVLSPPTTDLLAEGNDDRSDSAAQETYPQANNFDEMVDSTLSAVSSSSDNISVTETKKL